MADVALNVLPNSRLLLQNYLRRNAKAVLRSQIKELKMKRNANEATTCEAAGGKRSHWSAGLLVSMQDPALKVKEDDKIVAIKDMYPKAQFHYLVLPKANVLNIWSVKKEHVDLLSHMERVGKDLADRHKDYEFIFGYHARPSMQRLHLHVISTDFNSSYLSTKYHWNSFTTPFFMRSEVVREELGRTGTLKRMSTEECNRYLNKKLKCHKCSVTPKTMPELKRHLLTHLPNRTEN